MLLRPTPDDVFSMSSLATNHDQGLDEDDFHHHEPTTTLDDVWDSDPEPSSPTTANHHAQQPHPDDIPRLRAEHATAGYRDGLTAAKAASVQAGFDEGFELGATLGLQAGRLIGLLEGLAGASGDAELTRLLGEARTELGPKVIFGAEYWAPDGTWAWEVPGVDEAEVIFADVASAHPLVRKWEAVLEREVVRWGIDEKVLSEDVVREAGPESTVEAEGPKRVVMTGPKERDVLAW